MSNSEAQTLNTPALLRGLRESVNNWVGNSVDYDRLDFHEMCRRDEAEVDLLKEVASAARDLLIALEEPLIDFHYAMTDHPQIAADLAGNFACGELDALVNLLDTIEKGSGTCWKLLHARTDEVDDEHYDPDIEANIIAHFHGAVGK